MKTCYIWLYLHRNKGEWSPFIKVIVELQSLDLLDENLDDK